MRSGFIITRLTTFMIKTKIKTNICQWVSKKTPLFKEKSGFHSPLTDIWSCFKHKLILFNFSENNTSYIHFASQCVLI